MIFSYHSAIGQTHSKLFTGLVLLRNVPADLDFTDAIMRLQGDALRRLADSPEADVPAIRAWRAAFSTMGLKPTQYRCASEALLRRLRKDGTLPKLNPVVDICNATSVAYTVPVAAFDLERIVGSLTVRPATGDETYLTFGGDTEQPEPGEIIFADDSGAAHARRWTNRQSAASAISGQTRTALLVIEGLHDMAEHEVLAARDTLSGMFRDAGAAVQTGSLRGGDGHFVTDGDRA
jgi:DNA/RNA-binding domain of Phe-tRNA-synthetase-like protein